MRHPTSPSEYKAYLQRKNEEQARLLGKIGELQHKNAALRKELDWKTERLKLLSDCLHNIDSLLKKAATSVFVDALDAARKEAQL